MVVFPTYQTQAKAADVLYKVASSPEASYEITRLFQAVLSGIYHASGRYFFPQFRHAFMSLTNVMHVQRIGMYPRSIFHYGHKNKPDAMISEWLLLSSSIAAVASNFFYLKNVHLGIIACNVGTLSTFFGVAGYTIAALSKIDDLMSEFTAKDAKIWKIRKDLLTIIASSANAVALLAAWMAPSLVALGIVANTIGAVCFLGSYGIEHIKPILVKPKNGS
jgi:ABC-type multidrug transport system fused ATPase/permease subunit